MIAENIQMSEKIQRPRLVTSADCRAERNHIEAGDHIYVKVTLRDRIVAEFYSRMLSGKSAVIADIRRQTRGRNGLAEVYVRNHSRGWNSRWPLRLYGEEMSMPEQYKKKDTAAPSAGHAGAQRLMLFPWETH